MNKNAYMNGEIYIGDFEEFSISVDRTEYAFGSKDDYLPGCVFYSRESMKCVLILPNEAMILSYPIHHVWPGVKYPSHALPVNGRLNRLLVIHVDLLPQVCNFLPDLLCFRVSVTPDTVQISIAALNLLPDIGHVVRILLQTIRIFLLLELAKYQIFRNLYYYIRAMIG